jgi:hypothetical protein
MRKIYARRRFTAVMISFAIILFAGSGVAFSFASAGPATWDGVANVNASLNMSVSGSVGESSPGLIAHFDSAPANNLNIVAQHQVAFTQPGQFLIWHFYVENTGTIPTRITEINHENTGFTFCPLFQSLLGNNFEQFGFNAEILNENELLNHVFEADEVKTLRLLVQWAPDTSNWDYESVQDALNVSLNFQATMLTEIIYEPVFN